MEHRSLRYSWQWVMPAPPELVWPLVSDTHSFNRSIGLDTWQFTETPDPLGGSIREGSFRSLGWKVRWLESPFHWVEGQEFSISREFHSGPFYSMRSHLHLAAKENGTLLTYTIEAESRSFFWGIVARYYLGVHTRRRIGRTFDNLRRYLGGQADSAYPTPPPHLTRGGSERLHKAEAAIVKDGIPAAMARGLTRYIEETPNDMCNRIRPFELADAWGEHRESALRLCLHATRHGVLDLTWDIMCPLCRGEKGRTTSLSELRSQAHCSSCNIRFDANFDRSVEVTFRPASQIRSVEPTCYCIGGPQNTPHVMVQQNVPSKNVIRLSLQLAEGTYRLRGPKMFGTALLDVSTSYPRHEKLEFSCSLDRVSPEMVNLAPRSIDLSLENLSEQRLLILLEKMQWPDDAVTAARITALQDFRDLFSSEVLAPEEQFQVRYLAFMFTDLRASTALYRDRGDAPAYALVRDHFQVLYEWVAHHHGAVVKTIGDAVMAVFCEPAHAIAAGRDIPRAFSAPDSTSKELVLKIGVHAGPCIAVNLDGRLDYFGTTVNTAVRLEAHSQGKDVLVQANLMEDPVVRDVLNGSEVRTESLKAELKGFDLPVDICRITWDEYTETGQD